MTTLYKKTFILFFILSLCGCAQWEIQSQDLEIAPGQTEPIVVGEGIIVPQTLGPAPGSKVEQKPEPDSIDSFTEAVPQTTDLQTTSASSQVSTSPPREENVFGEFPGVSSQWEERKKQLTIQLQEQTQKTNEIKVKLQLINQVAELVSFVTKASVNDQNDFLMAFTIENRAPFAIKDIAITCDQIAPTGAIIRSHAETLYDIIKPSTRSTYAPILYGNKHRQTQSLQCQITNFTVENASSDLNKER